MPRLVHYRLKHLGLLKKSVLRHLAQVIFFLPSLKGKKGKKEFFKNHQTRLASA